MFVQDDCGVLVFKGGVFVVYSCFDYYFWEIDVLVFYKQI